MTTTTFSSLLISEYRKITSLKFWWALLIAPVVIGAFSSAIYASINSNDTVDELGLQGAFTLAGFYSSIVITVLFASVFGAVNAAAEIRHHTLETSFLSSVRGGVLAAKITVTAAFGAAYAVMSIVVSAVSQLIFSAGDFRLDGSVFAVILLGILVITLWTVIGAGLGLLFGSPTWAAVTLVVWVPVGELLVVGILSGLGVQPIARLLPGMSSLSALAAGRVGADDPFLTTGPGVAVLVIWAALFAGLGWYRTSKRDII